MQTGVESKREEEEQEEEEEEEEDEEEDEEGDSSVKGLELALQTLQFKRSANQNSVLVAGSYVASYHFYVKLWLLILQSKMRNLPTSLHWLKLGEPFIRWSCYKYDR